MIQAKLSVTEKSNGKKVYSVTIGDKLIYKSVPTHRTYVAMIGHDDFCDYRFGRLDLIGKGDSRHVFNMHPELTKDYWIAKL